MEFNEKETGVHNNVLKPEKIKNSKGVPSYLPCAREIKVARKTILNSTTFLVFHYEH